MEYKNQTYYWVLPLNEGKWTLAKHIEGTWTLIDGRTRLTNDLGQIGEPIPTNEKLFNQKRINNDLIQRLKKNHEIFLSVYNGNFKELNIPQEQILRDEMKDILELIKQSEQK